MVKRWWVVLLAVCLLCMTGCTSLGADVEVQLRPPQATGEQGLIEEALGKYIASTLTQENYVLKYPRAGAHRAAFLVEDVNGDGNREALAFYRLGAENGKTHINLLRQVNGRWESVHDYESAGTDLNSVAFGDMDGDGVRELFVCWNMYSSMSYQLNVYTLNGNRIAEKFSNTCARLAVADFTGNGLDECMLFNVSADALTATLWAVKDGEMVDLGQGMVDGYVQSLDEPAIAPLRGTRQAVFLDCQKSSDTMVTEFVYWDGSRLVAPLCETMPIGNVKTLRSVSIRSGDVDKDGAWEWPTCRLLTGYQSAEDNATDTTRWQTTYWSWDVTAERPVEKFCCVNNVGDGYYFATESDFFENYTTRYDDERRILWVHALENGVTKDPVLAIRAATEAVDSTVDGRRFESLIESDALRYSVWYSEEEGAPFNMETVRYRFMQF